jgi:hypothetical protein
MLVIAVLVASIISIAQVKDRSDIEVETKFGKTRYALGEPIDLQFTVKNISNKNIDLKGFDLKSQYLNLLISSNGNEYLAYGYSGVVKKTNGITLKSGESVNSASLVLCNRKPEVVGLSKGASDSIKKGKILTDYVFFEIGEYYLKTVLSIPNEDGNLKIESKPIKITITEPEGKDLEVWNKIKENGNFAYFIQEGDMLIPSYKPEERAKFQSEIEQILTDYPNSLYTISLSQSLAKFKASEVKRSEIMEKMKAKKP